MPGKVRYEGHWVSTHSWVSGIRASSIGAIASISIFLIARITLWNDYGLTISDDCASHALGYWLWRLSASRCFQTLKPGHARASFCSSPE
jgi:hypothetical protein